MSQLTSFIKKYIELSEVEKKQLVLISKSEMFDKNDLFIKQGEKCTKLAFLCSGSFRCFYTTQNGDEVNTEFILKEGFVTDFISYTRGTVSQLSIQALEKSDIIILNLRTTKIEKQLREKLKILGSNYVKNVCLPHLLNYQLIMSEKPNLRYELLSKKYPHYLQRISQKHIASYLRLRPETISRIRRKFIDLNHLSI